LVTTIQSDFFVVDTMVVSALMNAGRRPALAADYEGMVGHAPIALSFASVTELRNAALKAARGNVGVEASSVTSPSSWWSSPMISS
jgi:hypothetical protein